MAANAASEVQSLSRYFFCSWQSNFSRRMNREATFLALGFVPAVALFYARGIEKGGLPAASARRSSAMKVAQIFSLLK